MFLTQFMKITLAIKLNCGSDEFSVIHVKMDHFNGATFWCVIDGEYEIKQVRTKFK